MPLMPFSLSPLYDYSGQRIESGMLKISASGTSQLVPVFYDANFRKPATNPVALQSNGVVPPRFIRPGTYRFRIEGALGDTLTLIDGVEVFGAPTSSSDDSESGKSNAMERTGNLLIRLGEGILKGYVRLNGKTIGSASSGASEYAGSEVDDLYHYLWNTLEDVEIVGGKGSSADVDWSANKALVLPDLRGRILCGLSTMGNTALSSYDALTFEKGNASTLASTIGAPTLTLLEKHLPSHRHEIKGHTESDGTHTHPQTQEYLGEHTHNLPWRLRTMLYDRGSNLGYSIDWIGTKEDSSTTNVATLEGGAHKHVGEVYSSGAHQHTLALHSETIGEDVPIQIMPPSFLICYYIKL